jgi:CTP:molybdopterin cytidylyltransferase MocA
MACGSCKLPARRYRRAATAGIGPADLELLIAGWRVVPHKIVSATAGGIRGPPAILPRALFREVRNLRGDAGARQLLRDPARSVVEFELPRARLDIDSPRDLMRFARHRVRKRLA